MATISFNIPDAQAPRLLAALADQYGVQATSVAVKAAVVSDWREITINYELRLARQAIVPPSAPPIT